MKATTKKQIEKVAGVAIRHGWILDGAGPARYGYARLDACKETWLGRTLAEVAAALGIEP